MIKDPALYVVAILVCLTAAALSPSVQSVQLMTCDSVFNSGEMRHTWYQVSDSLLAPVITVSID